MGLLPRGAARLRRRAATVHPSDAADARARRDVDTRRLLTDLPTSSRPWYASHLRGARRRGDGWHGCARLPRAVVADDADETASAAAADADGDRVVALNSRDACHAEVRDLNIDNRRRLGDRAGETRSVRHSEMFKFGDYPRFLWLQRDAPPLVPTCRRGP